MKNKIIDIETHAFFRMIERGAEYGLDYFETKEKVYCTVKRRKLSTKKHFSKKNKTYYNYFNDNLSFYVICQESENKILIKTVIIEQGRE